MDHYDHAHGIAHHHGHGRRRHGGRRGPLRSRRQVHEVIKTPQAGPAEFFA